MSQFPNISQCLSGLRFVADATHYAKGTTLYFTILSAYRIASSGSISPVIDLLLIFPLQYSSLLLNVSYLALEDGTPIFGQI